MLVCYVRLRFALWRFDVFKVGGNCLSQRVCCAVAVIPNGVDPGTIGFEFDGFAARVVYDLSAIFDLLALSAVLPPLDVVVSLRMKLDLTAHANLIAEFTVRLHDGGVEVPVSSNFHFFDDIDANFPPLPLPPFDPVCNPPFRRYI